MLKKVIPYAFLGLLALILFFILGFRAGQQIEVANKNITLLISQVPTPTAAPTQMPIAFKTYKHPGCGISFLYPNNLAVEKESTQEARLGNKGGLGISFSCFPQAFTVRPTTNPDWAATFQNQQIVRKENGDGTETFMLRHPVTGRFITITTQDSLYPLLEKSLEFVVKK